MKRATFETNIDLVGVKIDNLELEDITIKGFIDMSDAKVNSFKIFGTLTDTNSVYLTNFTYNLLNKNSANFLEDKLREMRYIPQPFEQFAKVAKQIGWHKQAEDVLGNLKDKEIQQKIAEKNLPIALGLIIQRFVIGYGYKIEYSFYWSLVFLFIGFFLAAAKNILVKKVQTTLECWQFLQELKKTAQGVLHFYWIMLLEKRNDPKKYYMIIWESFVYTLDALLPIIELEQKHKDIQVSENIFIKSYFYFLNLWGYLVFALLLPLLF
ncbi:MAG TPA: hypothetical protein DCF68_07445 [Cyanothece sp. UBA12306]|nr:hypothetical protein [Cyanothece sp. UBA12306]